MRFILPLALVAAAAACSADEVDYTGKVCPCGPGWVCEPSSNTCMRAGGPPCAVLLVVQPAVEGSGDAAIEERIETVHGCEVTAVPDDETVIEDADGKDLIVITSTSRSSVVGGLFRGSTVPLITWEAYVYPDLGMTDVTAGTHFGFVEEMTEITVVGPSHPLAAGLNGTVSIYRELTRGAWGRPAGEGTTVATVGEQAAVFYFRPGDRTVAERAIGCRIGLPLWDVSGNLFTDEGWALFDAATGWALDGCP